MKQAEIQVVFVSRENLDKVIGWTKTIPSVQKIVVWGSSGDLPSLGNLVMSYEACLEKSDEALPTIAAPPKPEDLAIIMYTSGTT